MKLALFGHGAMGRLVEARALSDGHEIGLVVTSRDADASAEELAAALRGHDAAIDFSVAAAVLRNVEACARAGVTLVEGTTGWHSQIEDARRVVAERGGSLVYGANFSVGVNLFYRVVRQAAELFAAVEGYEPFVEEAHHSRKRDAPSGTALKLRAILRDATRKGGEVSVASTRAGHIPGTHRVGFDSAVDQITLTHEARSREGFVEGALLAARRMRGRPGVLEFSEILDGIISDRGGDDDGTS
ncbi:MAG TPA: dihydrodipicolinate reductase C-terminal domain-containing protein [Pyrinomonadaceae bacterium]|nr:dihydrodipicolinate reductase C-terminal domain-containing protein [Pyrinomonadaceae bacterium]